MNRKYVSVIAGPNGSGKTTIIDKLQQDGELPSLYVSPDLSI
jgi:predicted ABC-type ATPase